MGQKVSQHRGFVVLARVIKEKTQMITSRVELFGGGAIFHRPLAGETPRPDEDRPSPPARFAVCRRPTGSARHGSTFSCVLAICMPTIAAWAASSRLFSALEGFGKRRRLLGPLRIVAAALLASGRLFLGLLGRLAWFRGRGTCGQSNTARTSGRIVGRASAIGLRRLGGR